MTFYQATAPTTNFPSLTASIECQVCIIGAGYAGLSTAMGLIERGVRDIVILEAEHIGFGASGRNGGFVFGGFSLGNRDLVKQLGKQRARHLYQLTLDSVELIRQRIARYAIDCDLVESGVLLTNWFNDDSRLINQRDFMRNHFDVEWPLWSREKTQEQLQTNRYFGALHETNAFHFHPLKYAQGLAASLASQEVDVFEFSKVKKIDSTGTKHLIQTEHGKVSAQQVVVCCGGYIEQLLPSLARSVLSIATFAMTTEPLGGRLKSAVRTNAAVYDNRFAFDYYRPLADSRLLWGGRITITDKQPKQVAALLYGDMMKVYPQLDGVKIDYAWSGLMSYASHQMPQIGRLSNGLWYAMGFGGHGISTTTLAGETLAHAIATKGTLPDEFTNFGLPYGFGAIGLLAAQCTYWYYELKDWWAQ